MNTRGTPPTAQEVLLLLSYLGVAGTPSQDGHPGVPLIPDLAGVPPRKDMGPVEVLWHGDGVPPRCGQTPVKTVPSRRTTYAGGNNFSKVIQFHVI